MAIFSTASVTSLPFRGTVFWCSWMSNHYIHRYPNMRPLWPFYGLWKKLTRPSTLSTCLPPGVSYKCYNLFSRRTHSPLETIPQETDTGLCNGQHSQSELGHNFYGLACQPFTGNRPRRASAFLLCEIHRRYFYDLDSWQRQSRRICLLF